MHEGTPGFITPCNQQENPSIIRKCKLGIGWSLSILTITGNGFIIFIVFNKRELRTKTRVFRPFTRSDGFLCRDERCSCTVHPPKGNWTQLNSEDSVMYFVFVRLAASDIL